MSTPRTYNKSYRYALCSNCSLLFLLRFFYGFEDKHGNEYLQERLNLFEPHERMETAVLFWCFAPCQGAVLSRLGKKNCLRLKVLCALNLKTDAARSFEILVIQFTATR
jgi:hypothetical protein